MSESTPAGLPYHQILRGGRRPAWLLSFAGILGLIVLYVIGQLLVLAAVAAYYAAQGHGADGVGDLLSGDPVTPGFLLAVNLSWAIGIGLVWLMVRALHGLRVGWAASVARRIRWGWFAVSFGLALAALIITVVVSAMVPGGPAGDGTEVSGQLNDFTSATRDFLIVIVLFTPLQAAGEEYVFRGYLTQAVGSWLPWPKVSVVASVAVPALLFAIAHGGQEWPIFINRFSFGVIAGILVLVTGGLEAGIAMHVLNNFFAFGLALAFGDMTASLNPSGASWWSLVPTLTQSLSYLGLCLLAARMMGVRARTEPTVLAAPPPRV